METNMYKEAVKILIRGKIFYTHKSQDFYTIEVYDEDGDYVNEFYVTNEEYKILNRALESLEDEE